MPADIEGNNLQGVNIPITGACAWAPVDAANIVADADLADPDLALLTDYPAYVKLGLIKADGGVQAAAESGDRIEFFQDGYSLASSDTHTVEVGLAQGDSIVQRFLHGVAPNNEGVYYVTAAVPDNQFILFTEVIYKNGAKERCNGIAVITQIASDKAERGATRGYTVTLQWQASTLTNGAKYKVAHVAPQAA
ncbi:MAG: hypothetical protein LBK42_13770 [Propionibacteriaceae bacterium]|jgi:hypothetical protein|nr:hypothetical protein [Propionibacteriaceae bacterium]